MHCVVLKASGNLYPIIFNTSHEICRVNATYAGRSEKDITSWYFSRASWCNETTILAYPVHTSCRGVVVNFALFLLDFRTQGFKIVMMDSAAKELPDTGI